MRLVALSMMCVVACSATPEASSRSRRDAGSDAALGATPLEPAPQVVVRDAFAFDPSLFEKKRPPRAGEWLAEFREPAQTFEQWRSRGFVKPEGKRTKLVLQPLGSMSASDRKVVDKARDYMSAFFGLPVEIAAPMALPVRERRTRSEGGRTWTQSATKVLLDQVLLPKLPDDAIAYLGVTLEDLYPEPSWNFVFGQARLDERVGVYSLARFFPRFEGEAETALSARLALRRSLAILAHEAGHMFTIKHCTAYECVMNGSNSREELDRQREMLCPVCLRKLAHAIGFDVAAREEALLAFYRREGLDDLAHWTERRLAQLKTGTAPPEQPALHYARP